MSAESNIVDIPGPMPNPSLANVLSRLHAEHLAELRRSGLSDEQIGACEFYSESDPMEVATILNRDGTAAAIVPCLVIPFGHGYARVKPDHPRLRKGKRVKYESPVGHPNRAYFPPGTRSVLHDPSYALIMTEGEKKAAKADQEGFWTVGLVGVWGWQQPRQSSHGKKVGPRLLIHNLEAIEWAGRVVYIVFDSDATRNRKVLQAEWHLALALLAAGAIVRIVRLPPGANGAKVGLDDFLVANDAHALAALLERAEAPQEPTDGRVTVHLRPAEHEVISETIAALASNDGELYPTKTRAGSSAQGDHPQHRQMQRCKSCCKDAGSRWRRCHSRRFWSRNC